MRPNSCADNPQRLAQDGREIIDRQLRQMTRPVDDLLDVSRIAAGRVELDIESSTWGSCLGWQRQHAAYIRRCATAGHVEHSDGTSACARRSVRLLQVFSNLLQNATKYTPRGGNVRVDLQRNASDAVVRVIDDGIGIPTHMLEKVFDLFAQVDPSDRRARSGLGIGLTLAERLVELHGGTIRRTVPAKTQAANS